MALNKSRPVIVYKNGLLGFHISSIQRSIRRAPLVNLNGLRFCHSVRKQCLERNPQYIDAVDHDTFQKLFNSFFVFDNFITDSEELSLLKESENYLRRLRYESAHWDDAIHGYREVERQNWNKENANVLDRVKKIAFSDTVSTMSLVHVLDLQKTGYIKPHVDSVKFCGSVIAGLSLLSPSVMRLALEKDPTKYADCLLPTRSLYIMTGTARYDFTHEILKEQDSVFKGVKVPRDRRISVMCRCEPQHKSTLKT